MKNRNKYLFRSLMCGLLSAILITAFPLTSAADPMDMQAYSTNRFLIFNGVALPGIVEINGEAFFPAEYLSGGIPGSSVTRGASLGMERSQSQDGWGAAVKEFNGYFLNLDAGPVDYAEFYEMYGEAITNTVKMPDYRMPIGTAAPSGMDLHYDQYSYSSGLEPINKYISDAVYLLDGEYPLLRLSKLGIEDNGGDIVWNTGDLVSTSGTVEPDLVGEAVKGLIRDNPRETATAIHDYIVNTLTYDPRVYDAITYQSKVTAEDKLAADNASAAAAGYRVGNNFTLASRYGTCGSYAALFCDMCVRAGIPCVCVSGCGVGFRHSWNKVFIDGKWQYVDCTFDDPGSSSKETIIRHDYFLVSADALAKNHIWEGDDCPMPREYDPSWEQINPNNIMTADEFRKCTAAQIHQGKTEFTLTIASEEAYGGSSGLTASVFWYGVRLRSHMETRSGNTYTYVVEYV